MPFDAGVDGMTEGVKAGASRPLLASLSEGGAPKGRKESPQYSLPCVRGEPRMIRIATVWRARAVN